MQYPSLKELKSGDFSAWTALTVILVPKVRAAARHKIGTSRPTEVEDIESEVFAWLVRKVATDAFVDQSHLEARAIIKARSIALDHLRRDASRPPISGMVDEEDKTQASEHSSSPADDAVERELASILLQLLGSLSEKRRLILKSIYLDDRTQQETANLLGIPIGTVGVECSRGLSQIRQEVRQHPQLLAELKDNQEGLRLTFGVLISLLIR